jgi:hypothetical protein
MVGGVKLAMLVGGGLSMVALALAMIDMLSCEQEKGAVSGEWFDQPHHVLTLKLTMEERILRVIVSAVRGSRQIAAE